MLKHLLQHWSKAPSPWFSKRYLESLSRKDFRDLEAKKVLLYELPKGDEETVFEPRCPRGCSLFVETNGNELEAICIEHPEEGSFPITKDHLNRYKYSMEELLKRVQAANKIEGVVARIGRGFCFGHKNHGDKTVGFLILPEISEKNLVEVAGFDKQLTDYDYSFVVTPELTTSVIGASKLGDRLVIASLDEVLNYSTLKISLDPALNKLRLRGVLSDMRLEMTGNSKKGDQEIKINGQAVYISTASYLLLFKFFQAAINNVERWVSVDDIEVVNKEGVYQAVNRLKKEIVGSLPTRVWDEYFENENKQYRLSKNVTGLIYDRPKLVKHGNGRIKSIAESLPITRKLKTTRSIKRASRPGRK